MKKLLVLLCFSASIASFCQDATVEKQKESTIFERKNEVKVGAIKLLGGPIFEATYEYIHSKNFTYGSSILISLEKNSDYPEDFSVTPFARFYFQETKEYGANGFFVEGFGKYVTGRWYPNLFNDEDVKYSAASLGIALGKKWINSSGFVFEILVGAGRNLGGGDIPAGIFRGDFNLGYRF